MNESNLHQIPEYKPVYEKPSYFPRDFKGIWIPREIWLDKRLTYFEKCLLAEIYSLDGPENGCYASNQYFMDFFDERERKIQDGLSKLKKLGYIKVEAFNGRIRTLRSDLNPDKTLFSTPQMSNSAPLGCQKSTPLIDRELPERDNKVDNKDKKERESTPTLYQRDGKVTIELSAYNKLIDEFGVDKIKEMIARLNEYADINPKRFNAYANHATVIRKWIREDKQKASNLPQDQISHEQVRKDKELTKQAFLVVSKEELELLGEGPAEITVRIPRTGEVTAIYFGKPHTKDMINNVLRKLGRMPLSDI